jgi:hypothetical protein
VKGSASAVAGLIVLAVIFAVIAVLYALGILQVLAHGGDHTHHYKHAILFGGLALLSLVAASFMRPRAAAPTA